MSSSISISGRITLHVILVYQTRCLLYIFIGSSLKCAGLFPSLFQSIISRLMLWDEVQKKVEFFFLFLWCFFFNKFVSDIHSGWLVWLTILSRLVEETTWNHKMHMIVGVCYFMWPKGDWLHSILCVFSVDVWYQYWYEVKNSYYFGSAARAGHSNIVLSSLSISIREINEHFNELLALRGLKYDEKIL